MSKLLLTDIVRYEAGMLWRKVDVGVMGERKERTISAVLLDVEAGIA